MTPEELRRMIKQSKSIKMSRRKDGIDLNLNLEQKFIDKIYDSVFAALDYHNIEYVKGGHHYLEECDKVVDYNFVDNKKFLKVESYKKGEDLLIALLADKISIEIINSNTKDNKILVFNELIPNKITVKRINVYPNHLRVKKLLYVYSFNSYFKFVDKDRFKVNF